MNSVSAQIVILNYNGEKLLPQCLPSIVDAAKRSRHKVSVTLLDNHSTDRGTDYAKEIFPDVRIWRAPANRFLCSYNDFAKAFREPVMIFLNNDIRVDPGFVDPLLAPFLSDDKMFLVAPRVMNFDGNGIQAARSKAGWKWGTFWCNARYPGHKDEAMTASDTYSSGFGAFSRDLFLSLDGYDDRYLPGILEDVDLCHRARKAGYRLRYEPESVVYHHGQATFTEAFGSDKVEAIAHRNTFYFMWKNFSVRELLIRHYPFLPFRLLLAAVRGQKSYLQGYRDALNGR